MIVKCFRPCHHSNNPSRTCKYDINVKGTDISPEITISPSGECEQFMNVIVMNRKDVNIDG